MTSRHEGKGQRFCDGKVMQGATTGWGQNMRDVIIGRSLIANPIIKSLITKKILLIITSKHSYFTLLYDNLITII